MFSNKNPLIEKFIYPKVVTKGMEKNTNNGFEFIDLNDPYITEAYRSHPASDPSRRYVARLKCDNENGIVVESVFRLIRKPNRKIEDVFVTRVKDGKKLNLAVRVKKGPVFDSLVSFYDDRFRQRQTVESYDHMYGQEPIRGSPVWDL